MHSRDATVLIDLLWYNVVHYSSLFQYFFQSTMVPTLVENSYFFSVPFFWNTIIMIMIEIQYSSTALLLLVNPHIPHQNNGTARPTYVYQLLSDTLLRVFQMMSIIIFIYLII